MTLEWKRRRGWRSCLLEANTIPVNRVEIGRHLHTITTETSGQSWNNVAAPCICRACKIHFLLLGVGHCDPYWILKDHPEARLYMILTWVTDIRWCNNIDPIGLVKLLLNLEIPHNFRKNYKSFISLLSLREVLDCSRNFILPFVLQASVWDVSLLKEWKFKIAGIEIFTLE